MGHLVKSPDTAQTKLSVNLIGIAWMIATGLFFVGVTVVVRHLASEMVGGLLLFR